MSPAEGDPTQHNPAMSARDRETAEALVRLAASLDGAVLGLGTAAVAVASWVKYLTVSGQLRLVASAAASSIADLRSLLPGSGGEPRLARCLSTVASLGGWEGGVAGSGQGIAAHMFRGSHIAVMAEAHGEGGRIVVDRLVAAVDVGRVVNPDLVRQQVEGGLIFGLAHALGAATGFDRGLATVRGFDTLRLPRLADTPDITVELIRSDEAPGGVAELAVPPVAPAIANAIRAATGYRIRTLPLRMAP